MTYLRAFATAKSLPDSVQSGKTMRSLAKVTSLCSLAITSVSFGVDATETCTNPMPSRAVGAWIFTDEAGPDLNYWSPDGPYQALKTNGVYNYVDILGISFIDTVPVSDTTVPSTNDGATGYTLQFTGGGHNQGTAPPEHPMPPDGYTNQQYFEWIVEDARSVRADIEITVTLLWGNADTLSRIFNDPNNPDPGTADNFASNVVAFLDHYDINGIEIDWETPICDSLNTPSVLFTTLFTAIGEAFQQESPEYMLNMSPANNCSNNQGRGSFDSSCAAVVNEYFYAVNLQTYYSEDVGDVFATQTDTNPFGIPGGGIERCRYAFGICYESDCNQSSWSAQETINQNVHNYSQYMMWRLNSDNWQTEQQKQIDLYRLVYGSSPGDVDGDGDFDTDDITAAHDQLGTNPADLNFDGCVDGADLGQLLGHWGCPKTP